MNLLIDNYVQDLPLFERLKQNPTGEQTANILNHLRSATITPLEALNLYGCFRLAARIHDIRKMGYDVRTGSLETESGKRVAVYSLES